MAGASGDSSEPAARLTPEYRALARQLGMAVIDEGATVKVAFKEPAPGDFEPLPANQLPLAGDDAGDAAVAQELLDRARLYQPAQLGAADWNNRACAALWVRPPRTADASKWLAEAERQAAGDPSALAVIQRNRQHLQQPPPWPVPLPRILKALDAARQALLEGRAADLADLRRGGADQGEPGSGEVSG